MPAEEQVYRELQEHLDKQAVGYPATKSGVELRILKRFFDPGEARLAVHLNYKPRSLNHIYDTAKEMGISINDMEKMIDKMVKSGVIGCVERGGVRYFHNIPFIIGIYERQLSNLSPEFLDELEEYTSDKAFGLEFLRTGLPQMRTIPVSESIPHGYHITNYEHLTEIINGSEEPIVVCECICRKKAGIKGTPCKVTTRMETCMAFGDIANYGIGSGIGRVISKAEALAIVRLNESDGLVLQPSNTQKIDFVCACCGCCCGILRLHKRLPKPIDYWSTNYYAEVNAENCTGCGTCVERCQVNGINIDELRNVSEVNLDRCIGCGNCVVSCPSGAISLLKKEKELIPPLDTENLYDIIKARRRNAK